MTLLDVPLALSVGYLAAVVVGDVWDWVKGEQV